MAKVAYRHPKGLPLKVLPIQVVEDLEDERWLFCDDGIARLHYKGEKWAAGQGLIKSA